MRSGCVLGRPVRLAPPPDTIQYSTTPRGLGERKAYPGTGIRAGKAAGNPGCVCVIDIFATRARMPTFLAVLTPVREITVRKNYSLLQVPSGSAQQQRTLSRISAPDRGRSHGVGLA